MTRHPAREGRWAAAVTARLRSLAVSPRRLRLVPAGLGTAYAVCWVWCVRYLTGAHGKGVCGFRWFEGGSWLASSPRLPTSCYEFGHTHTHTHTHSHTRMGCWGGCWIGSRRVGRGCGRRLAMGSGGVFARRASWGVRGLPPGSLTIYLPLHAPCWHRRRSATTPSPLPRQRPACECARREHRNSYSRRRSRRERREREA